MARRPADAALSPSPAEARLDALLQQYGALIAWAVRRVAGGRQPDVDDIRQNVVVALWSQLRRGRAIAYPPAYIHRIAVREAVRAVARARAQRGEPLDDEVADAPLGAADDPAQRREHRDAVRAAVASLPLDRRRAVQGHLAGFSVHELMDLYDWPYQRARNLIARGMADLRVEVRARLDGVAGQGQGGEVPAASQARARSGPAAAQSWASAR